MPTVAAPIRGRGCITCCGAWDSAYAKRGRLMQTAQPRRAGPAALSHYDRQRARVSDRAESVQRRVGGAPQFRLAPLLSDALRGLLAKIHDLRVAPRRRLGAPSHSLRDRPRRPPYARAAPRPPARPLRIIRSAAASMHAASSQQLAPRTSASVTVASVTDWDNAPVESFFKTLKRNRCRRGGGPERRRCRDDRGTSTTSTTDVGYTPHSATSAPRPSKRRASDTGSIPCTDGATQPAGMPRQGGP